jgi:integrase
MTDARSRELKPDSISKLERIFKKQLLNWARVEGLEYLDELDLDALLSFRSTWTEGAIVRSKKQERLKGFFWACFRRNYISQIPALGLGKIKTGQIPTDYFPQDEFDTILAAIDLYGDPRGGFIDIEDTRTRLRTMTLLMRWSGLRIRDAITLERQSPRWRQPSALSGQDRAANTLFPSLQTGTEVPPKLKGPGRLVSMASTPI